MGWRNFWSAIAAAVLVVTAADALADDYHPAERLGAVDLSVGCPSGSSWDPRNDGECRACPSGFRMVGFECLRAVAGELRTAPFSGRHRATVVARCPSGTFPAGATRRCHYCPEGFSHNAAFPVEVPGVCFKAPRVERRPAEVVQSMTLAELVDPARVLREVPTLGCAAHGSRAFFDPIQGGSCWSCPTTHPVRTVFPVHGTRACAGTSCGAAGGRPCYVWERLPSCDAGLVEDPLSNTCVAPQALVCPAIVAAANATRATIEDLDRRGAALTDEVLDSLPWLRSALAAAETVSGEAEALMSRAFERMPLEQVLAALDGAFPSPAAVERVNAVIAALARRQAELVAILADPDQVCSGDGMAIRQLFHSAATEAGGRRGDVEAEQRFAERPGVRGAIGLLGNLGPSSAHAQVPRPLAGWSFGYSLSGTLNVRKGTVVVPVSPLGLQIAVEIGATPEETSLAVFYVAGVDIVRTSPPSGIGSIDHFFTVGWPGEDCRPDWLGAGLVLLDTIGVGFCSVGATGLSIKLREAEVRRVPTINITDVKGQLTEIDPGGLRFPGGWTRPSWFNGSIGINGAVALFRRGDLRPRVSFAQ